MKSNNKEFEWKFDGYRGMKVSVVCVEHNGQADFEVYMDNGKELRCQVYPTYTENEKIRRAMFLDEGKNPCGKWIDRDGIRICFKNAKVIC